MRITRASGFRAFFAFQRTTAFFCELQEHPHNHDHNLYYKWDVAKWCISEPSTPCLGIFWNPDKECVQEVFFKPLIPLSSEPCRPTTSLLNGFRTFPNDKHAPVFASIPHSNQGYTNNLEYKMERHQLDLADALHRLLHTGTHHDDPVYMEDVHFSRLAVDTVMWVFGEDPKIIPNNEAWYIRGAIHNVGEMEMITYGDGSHVDVDIHTGPFYLRAGLRSSGSSFRVCHSPNFVFGVATRATEGFKNGRIDGILDLGLKTGGRMKNFVNSLYREDLIDVECFFSSFIYPPPM
ncbi:hypothetical protein B0H14DRAFT_2996009, partial [Mycena olivaceomarginata]